MKLTIDKNDLGELLKKVISATEKKSALPVLANFLVEGKDDKLVVQGTDLEVHVLASTSASIEEEGAVCVNAKKFTDISKLLPKNEVKIEKENNKLKITSGKTKYSLPIFPTDEFPQMHPFPENTAFSVSGDALLEAIRKTSYATSKEESRFALQGVLFKSVGDSIDVVATDGHRLALYKIEKTGVGDIEVIVPPKALNELKKLTNNFDDVEIASTEQYTFFRSTNWILMSRVLEGAFPDYNQVIPEEFSIEIKVDKKEFLESIKRVIAIIEGEPKPVKLTLKKGILELKTFSPEFGEAVDQLEIDYEGDEYTIGFNGKYIIDAVSVIDEDEIEIKFTNPEAQTLFTPVEDKNYLAIVMPMEINF